MLAGLGIIGLALGFAFQEIAANFISGIILSINKPFTIGDIVEVDGNFGVVESVSLRTTNIRTFQGQKVMIPNKTIFQNAITNFTENGKRRVDLEVGISYGDDLEKVQGVTLAAVNSLTKVLANNLASSKILVNAIAPGFIATEMTAKLDQDVVANWVKEIPLKRAGQPEDVADVEVFLASDMSAYVTGQTIHVCGGMLT